MTISVGDKIPEATLSRIGENGPEQVSLQNILRARRVVLFALPGAFTPTCSAAHVPSFMRTAADLAKKGVDEIVCVSVNDPYVMQAWGAATGGVDAGITFLADADSSYTKSLGLAFDAPPAGFFGRSVRYSMLIENGVLKILNVEAARGVCEMTAGETILGQI